MEESRPSSVRRGIQEAQGEHVSAIMSDWMQGNAASATAAKTELNPGSSPSSPQAVLRSKERQHGMEEPLRVSSDSYGDYRR